MKQILNTAPLRRRIAEHSRAIFRLGGPLIVTNLAITGMNFTDTVMAGQLGAIDLAAVAVGSAFYFLFYLAGLGMLMALSPLVAHYYGAGGNRVVGELARQGLWLSQMIVVAIILPLLCVRPALTAIGIGPEVLPKAVGFVYAISTGVPAIMAFLVLRFVSEGIGWTRPIMYTALIGLVVNIFGCYVFMYGKLGLPALGAVGTGVSHALVMWLMFLFMFRYVRRHRIYRPFELFSRFEMPRAARLREILALGAPICGSVISEAGLFVAAALIMGTLGAVQVAAHQIAINYAALMFMIPLSLHSAMTIHVGHALGRGDAAEGRFGGWVGVGLCTVFMMASALVLVAFNNEIAAFYTQDEAVRALAASLLIMAAVFQVSDGLQVAAAGALRGFKDARIPMLLNLLAYWAVGFPLAYWLGIEHGAGPRGIWMGLIVGLSVCAVLLNARFWIVSNRAA